MLSFVTAGNSPWDLLLPWVLACLLQQRSENKLVLPVLAAMLPSAAYPKGHKRMVSLLCCLTGILHLCLAASLPSHSCDLESEQEVYALLNIALCKSGGVEGQLEGENTIPFFFLLSDSGLKFWKWRGTLLIESTLRYCILKTPPACPVSFHLNGFYRKLLNKSPMLKDWGLC